MLFGLFHRYYVECSTVIAFFNCNFDDYLFSFQTLCCYHHNIFQHNQYGKWLNPLSLNKEAYKYLYEKFEKEWKKNFTPEEKLHHCLSWVYMKNMLQLFSMFVVVFK